MVGVPMMWSRDVACVVPMPSMTVQSMRTHPAAMMFGTAMPRRGDRPMIVVVMAPPGMMAIMVMAMDVAVTMIVAMRVPEMPPMSPAVIPRAMAIVIVPVRIERERDDGHIDHVDIVR
jgi:hypothetical protein